MVMWLHDSILPLCLSISVCIIAPWMVFTPLRVCITCPSRVRNQLVKLQVALQDRTTHGCKSSKNQNEEMGLVGGVSS